MTEALQALDFLAGTPSEVVLVWPDGAAAAAASLLAVLRRTYLPSRVLAAGSESVIATLAEVVPFVRGKVAQAGRPTAYVCRRDRCELPVSEPAALEARLRAVAD